MKCPNCDGVLKNNPKFCPYCGSDLRELKKDTIEATSPKKKMEEKTQTNDIKTQPPKKEIQKTARPKRTKMNPSKKKTKVSWILLSVVPIVIVSLLFLFFNHKNDTYVVAMENGIDAVSDEEYNEALTYFDEALTVKKDDDKAEQWSQNTATLQEADVLYSNYEFEQALTKVNDILDTEIVEDDLTILFEKAEDLKINIEKIIAEQDALETDLQEAQKLFDEADADEKEIQGIIKNIEQILAREEINKEYHADIKKEAETLSSDVKAYEEKLIERKTIEADEAKKAEEAEKAKAVAEESEETIKKAVSKYSAKEIEYARIILMDGYPNGSTIYISENPAGRAIAAPYEETVKYPEPTVTLTGSYGADGMIVYSPIGGGYITVYPVPMHWHQDDQSAAGYREYTQQILNDAQKVYIDPGDPAELLEKLRTTEFIQSN